MAQELRVSVICQLVAEIHNAVNRVMNKHCEDLTRMEVAFAMLSLLVSNYKSDDNTASITKDQFEEFCSILIDKIWSNHEQILGKAEVPLDKRLLH